MAPARKSSQLQFAGDSRHWSEMPVAWISIAVVAVALAWLGLMVVWSGGIASQTIVVIPVHGDISRNSDVFSDSWSSDELVDALSDAQNDPSVAAVVLDIQSGGGAVVASKQIAYAVRDVNKPVVSYIGDVGASGAYYIAAASDFIIADEDSLTGSIGVFSMVVDASQLLDDWNVQVHIVESGAQKSMGNPFSDFSAQDEQILSDIIAQTFAHFVRDVRLFRGTRLNSDAFETVLDGRIVSGEQALQIGLIDATGLPKDAYAKAAELAGISGEPNIEWLSAAPVSFLDLLSRAGFSLASGFSAGVLHSQQTAPLRA